MTRWGASSICPRKVSPSMNMVGRLTHPPMPNTTYAPVVIKAGREKPIVQHHPWVFSGAIDQIPSAIPDGEIVDLVNSNGKWLARGLLNRVSQIQVRILTWQR